MIEAINALLRSEFPDERITAQIDERNIVTLSGECSTWAVLIQIGHAVAKVPGVRNVVSDMTAKGVEIPKKDYTPVVEEGRRIGEVDSADVVIVGAGVSGCGIARELARYNLKIVVVEKGDDVASGASKANNGDIHPGHAVKPGTLKAKLNVRGNRMYTQWAKDLGFELQRCGSLKVVTSEKLVPEIEKMYAVAVINGVDGARLVRGDEIAQIEPRLGEEMEKAGVKPVLGLWLPSFGLVEPYDVVVALAENAAENGVHFRLNCTVGDVLTENGQVTGVVTNQGIIRAKYVINCAGVYADEISEMAGDRCYTIHPRKGTIAILDKSAPPLYNALAGFATGNEVVLKKNVESKGGGMCRTPEFNILLGPSATEVPDKEDVETTAEDLRYAMSRNSNPYVGTGDIIKIFAGSRPADFKEDFVIEMSDKTHGFINVGAIQSPGLASAPAVAEMACGILLGDLQEHDAFPSVNMNFNPIRKRRVEFRHMTNEQRDELIRRDPRYGRIICRCEQITEGEILDAIHSPIVPGSIDAIKRRTRAGMGRCQGGFCQPRVLEILARELGKDPTEITLKGEGSNVLLCESRSKVNEGGADK
ncbi:FAD-dependent oxidoreductase [Angelakisella massiliensis]|uniref:FAD-dependent oxidoreductase n=1 Tax=Angelakisella massiliensis TaxID=1871018 RepID=UPI0024B0E98D|nr:FAD-dependent oxidoreductase [Angelakisella massiliensis]